MLNHQVTVKTFEMLEFNYMLFFWKLYSLKNPKTIRFLTIFYSIAVLLYFWLNKCSLGEHMRWMFHKYYKKLLPTPESHVRMCCQIFIGTKACFMLFIRSHSNHIFTKEYLSLLFQWCYRGLQLLLCKWGEFSWDGTEFWCYSYGH